MICICVLIKNITNHLPLKIKADTKNIYSIFILTISYNFQIHYNIYNIFILYKKYTKSNILQQIYNIFYLIRSMFEVILTHPNSFEASDLLMVNTTPQICIFSNIIYPPSISYRLYLFLHIYCLTNSCKSSHSIFLIKMLRKMESSLNLFRYTLYQPVRVVVILT